MTEQLITGATVRPGGGAAPIKNGAVLVRGDEIAAVGEHAAVSAQASPSAVTTELPASCTLMPGLVDGFVRMSQSGSSTTYDDLHADHSAGELPERIADNARRALRAGVTTVRDAGDYHGAVLQFRSRVEREEALGPRILGSGAPLTLPGGDAAFLGGEVDSDDAIRAAVAERAAAGATFVAYQDSGSHFPGPLKGKGWTVQFSPEQCRLIATEAHRHGLRVSSHTFSAAGAKHAIAAGVDVVDQLFWRSGEGEAVDRDPEAARQMREHGIAACMPSGRNRLQMIADNGEEYTRRRWYSRYTWIDELGVDLLPGSSAGVTNSPFGDYVSALETYEWLGFGLDRIVDLATTGAARILGLDKTTGTLAAGYAADLIAVDGDPATDLQALRSVRLTMVRGHLLPD